MYETYYGKLQPYFGQENIQLHYIDTDAFVLSVNTKHIIEDLKNLENIFDFSNLDGNLEIFSNKNKELVGNFELETRKNNWNAEFVCLRSKMYSLKGEGDSNNKLKGSSKSQSKHIKFGEYKKVIDGNEYQEECDNCILKSVNHEMYFQKIKKSTPPLFDDIRCYLTETESKSWK